MVIVVTDLKHFFLGDVESVCVLACERYGLIQPHELARDPWLHLNQMTALRRLVRREVMRHEVDGVKQAWRVMDWTYVNEVALRAVTR